MIAAEQANAAKFIASLPEGLDTMCGTGGSKLSGKRKNHHFIARISILGGQKQRLAITRALVKKPCVLLLDEATSALDAESENIVQSTLHRVQKNVTCIIVAHRLSTVMSADKIAVIENGLVVEVGSHCELMEKKTAYYNLINSQL